MAGEEAEEMVALLHSDEFSQVHMPRELVNSNIRAAGNGGGGGGGGGGADPVSCSLPCPGTKHLLTLPCAGAGGGGGGGGGGGASELFSSEGSSLSMMRPAVSS